MIQELCSYVVVRDDVEERSRFGIDVFTFWYMCMSWIVPALVTIGGSVLLYLCLRIFKQHHITTYIQNAVMFIPMTVVFGILSHISGDSLWIWWEMIWLMFCVSVVCSWLANYMSLKSMQTAPNIWYPLMVSKSYVALAAVIAVWLFWSTLTITDICAIFLIIWAMSLILISPNVEIKNTHDSSWIWPAIYAHIWRAGLALASKRFINYGIEPQVVNFWIGMSTSLVILLQAYILKENLVPPKWSYMPALWVVIWMVIFNRWLQEWYALAPNPGYINAANASSIALLTLVSAWIFGDELSTRKLIGIVWVVVGISMLFVL